jgi:hypothetical protein
MSSRAFVLRREGGGRGAHHAAKDGGGKAKMFDKSL